MELNRFLFFMVISLWRHPTSSKLILLLVFVSGVGFKLIWITPLKIPYCVFWSCLLPRLSQVLCCFSYSSNLVCFFVKPSRTVCTAQFFMCAFPLETIKGSHRWIVYNIVWLNWLLRYHSLITMYLNCLDKQE